MDLWRDRGLETRAGGGNGGGRTGGIDGKDGGWNGIVNKKSF